MWSLDTTAKPYEWKKLEPEGECPPPCMYDSYFKFLFFMLLFTNKYFTDMCSCWNLVIGMLQQVHEMMVSFYFAVEGMRQMWYITMTIKNNNESMTIG